MQRSPVGSDAPPQHPITQSCHMGSHAEPRQHHHHKALTISPVSGDLRPRSVPRKRITRPTACAGSSGEEAFAASSPPATPHCTFLQVTAQGLQGGRLQGHWGSKTCTGRATVSLPTPGCSPQPPRAAVGKLCTQDVGTPRPTLHFTPASHLKVASNHVTALHAPLPTSQHHRHRGPPAACQSSHPASTSTALPANCKKLPHNPSPRLPHPP